MLHNDVVKRTWAENVWVVNEWRHGCDCCFLLDKCLHYSLKSAAEMLQELRKRYHPL